MPESEPHSKASSGGKRSRDWRLAVSPRVWIAVIAVVIVSSGFYFARRAGNDPRVYSNDFNVFYHASSEVLEGRDPYQTRLGDWTPYLYPPLLALLLTPLAMFPLPVAAYIWFLINATFTVCAARLSARVACNDVDESRRLPNSGSCVPMVAGVSLLVVARSVVDNFNLGQVNPVVCALVAAHVYLYWKDKRTASALALAIAASIKLTPLVLIGYHIARRRWKFGALCLGLFVAFTALSFAPFGSRAPAAFDEFVKRTIKNEQGYDLAYAGNQSLRGVVARITPAPSGDGGQDAGELARRPSNIVTLLLSLSLLAVAMIAAHKAKNELIAAAPFVCCIVLLSPLSWKAHFVMLIPAVAALAGAAARGHPARSKILIAVLAVVVVLFNLTSLRVLGSRAAEWSDAHSLAFIGALLIFGASIWASGWRQTVDRGVLAE